MLVLIGASASGKTEIAKLLIAKHGFRKMITYTTRAMRQGEVNGLDYHFVSVEVFKQKALAREFLETTDYNGNHYGTAFKDAERNRVVIVDIPGANVLYDQLKNDVVIVYIETPEAIREARMLYRGDPKDQVESRLLTDQIHFIKEKVTHIDLVIDNGNRELDTLTETIANYYKNRQ